MDKNNTKKDIIGGAVFGAIFLYAYLNVGRLPAKVKMWPQFVCVLGMVCCAILFIKSLLLLYKAEGNDSKRQPFNIDWKRTGLTVLVVAVWLGIMEEIGFLASTIPALFLLMLIPQGKKSKKQYLIYFGISIAFSVLLYLSFGLLLGSKLPEGYWYLF